ncbi:hypothetical protein PAQ31011_00967 [Pandoraea aquatica]|uniref:Uncharacterized protein n=1 Tax=Pandoraea aquatica TaxID=2508290 RepID=A0A5E4STV4_9BURK|nr:hypothetical protein PAQ31011_00967 [Pandoraea aquatica]
MDGLGVLVHAHAVAFRDVTLRQALTGVAFTPSRVLRFCVQ